MDFEILVDRSDSTKGRSWTWYPGVGSGLGLRGRFFDEEAGHPAYVYISSDPWCSSLSRLQEFFSLTAVLL